MENASKALLIAGGIFLAMLIVSILVYTTNSITELGEAQENRRAAEELAAFNAEYEAYNKQIMYGTDIITVINKAIANNEKIGTDAENFIDMVIKPTKQDFGGEVEVITKKADKTTRVSRKPGNELEQDQEYSLKNNSTFLKGFLNPSTLLNAPSIKDENDTITYTYSALQDFKRAIFKCTDIKYNNNTGKVNYMKFEQTDEATYK